MVCAQVKVLCERCFLTVERVGQLQLKLIMPDGVLVQGHKVVIRGLCGECASPASQRS